MIKSNCSINKLYGDDKMKIIDAHIHYRPGYEPFSAVAESSGHKNTSEHLKHEFEKNNIVHAIVMGNLSPELENHIYPEYMSYCFGLDSSCFKNPTEPPEYFISLAEEHLKRENCTGIKLYPGYCPMYLSDKQYEPFYELAEKHNKTVAIHTGALSRGDALLKYSHPLTIDEIAVKYPKVQFVMCHFGNPFLSEAAAVAEKNKNVAVDISGIVEGDFDIESCFEQYHGFIEILKSWLYYFGDYSRIMYGSDWPIVNIGKYIEFIKRIVPEKYHENVFFKNAVNIYNLKL